MKHIETKNCPDRDETAIEYHQYVTFIIEDEIYGAGVEKVKEIIGMTDITYVPNAAYFMEGVINLRGSVVPVADMRKKFKMKTRPYDTCAVIIIVETGERLIGLIVDSVSDVVNIPLVSIQAAQDFTARISSDLIEGIGQADETLIIILNTDSILSEEATESPVLINSTDNEADNPDIAG